MLRPKLSSYDIQKIISYYLFLYFFQSLHFNILEPPFFHVAQAMYYCYCFAMRHGQLVSLTFYEIIGL